MHGKTRTIEKITRDNGDVPDDGTMFDLEDKLLIRHDMSEWFFFASSVEEEGVVLPSSGQINLVQYRYTPTTVNVGYEQGSVETFEYGRDATGTAPDSNTVNGVPKPFIDTGRP
jgi:hypothetical protein